VTRPALGFGTGRPAGGNHRRLERPYEWPNEETAPGQRQDRIRDELARPVVGHLAPTLDPDQLDPAALELGGFDSDERFRRLAPEGQNRRVLEEQELIADQAVGALGGEPLLEGPGRSVVDAAEPADGERTGLDRIDRAVEDGRGALLHEPHDTS
jgi:hypothetical protein